MYYFKFSCTLHGLLISLLQKPNVLILLPNKLARHIYFFKIISYNYFLYDKYFIKPIIKISFPTSHILLACWGLKQKTKTIKLKSKSIACSFLGLTTYWLGFTNKKGLKKGYQYKLL